MFAKNSVVLTGTEHDNEGTISVSLECFGFVIEKKTEQSCDGGTIALTPRELVALVEKLKIEFPNTKWD